MMDLRYRTKKQGVAVTGHNTTGPLCSFTVEL